MPGLSRKAVREAWSPEDPAARDSAAGPTVAAENLRLLASLNHEIRTPLSGILGMTDLLLESGLSREQEEYVSAARECAEALFDLLNATLEFSSLQAGCIRLENSEFRPADLLEGVLREAGTRARARGIELRTRLEPGLDAEVIGDARRISQVMDQVLGTTIRYGGGEWMEVRFALEPEAAGSQTVFSIQASCEAMAPDGAGLASGAGLAFAVIDGLARLLGGRMDRVRDESAGRYQLTVSVPLTAAPEGRKHSVGREAGRPLRPPRILVVDDNRIAQQVIGALLGKGGWQFDTALDGFAALDAAAGKSYQLILMDLQMPGLDGLETTVRLREMAGYRDTPVLALTADVSDEVRARCRDAGMDAFIEKPVHSATLNSVLAQFLTSPDGD